jgi:beta-lactamase superfamily II metal-dependent hydrolase
MGYEVDFLAVGDGERSGDAIAFRYGDLHGSRANQTVVVIDGGTKETGQAVVDLVKKHYATDLVDFVVSSHPDGDHASGLTVVVDQLKVGKLLMHQPWEHAAEVRDMFKDGRLTVAGLEKKLEEALQAASDLEAAAKKRGVEIVEPFQGLSGCGLTVLGPARGYYESLIPYFRQTPTAKADASQALWEILAKAAGAAKEKVTTWVDETFDIETLEDSGETSAENNSSVILLADVDGKKLLFTADAGIEALTRAADFAQSSGIDLASLTFVQVPHHGSRHNVGPTILNRIKGKIAYISAAKKSEPKHPSKKVINAFTRRGAKVYKTQGQSIRHQDGALERAGYGAISPLPFYPKVEQEID